MNKILEVSEKFPQTETWIDSFHVDDHKKSLAFGITGITTSPTWVSRMLCSEPEQEHKEILETIYCEHPEYNEQELAWAWTLEMGRKRSQIMLPLWKKEQPRKGRFSIQISIFEPRNAKKMVEMSKEINEVAPNMQVKIPSTKAGIQAMEEATYQGISVMATLCFSVDQAIAVAEAIEQGMRRREQKGLSNGQLNPICAVLLGMQDDWLKNYAEANDIVIHPDALNWGGVAIFKKVYAIFKEKNYQTRLLSAYYRHQLHWSEFIGGDIIMTIPYKWQKRFAYSQIEIKDYMSIPVEEKKVQELEKLTPFLQAYNEGSLAVDDFDFFGPVLLTLQYFTSEYEKAIFKIREIMYPNPLK